MNHNINRYLDHIQEGAYDNIKAGLYAAARTAKTVTKPFVWAHKKVAKGAYKGATAVAKGTTKIVKDKTVGTIKKAWKKRSRQRKMKKLLGDKYRAPAKKQGMVGAIAAGLRDKPKPKNRSKQLKGIPSPWDVAKKIFKKRR